VGKGPKSLQKLQPGKRAVLEGVDIQPGGEEEISAKKKKAGKKVRIDLRAQKGKRGGGERK